MNIIFEDAVLEIVKNGWDSYLSDPEYKEIRRIYRFMESKYPGITNKVIDQMKKNPPAVDYVLGMKELTQNESDNCIYVDYGRESSDSFIGTVVDEEETDDGVLDEIVWEMQVQDLSIWILCGNKFDAKHCYYITRAIIIKNVIRLGQLGIVNMKFIGGNIDRELSLMPNLTYARRISLSFEYATSEQNFESAITGEAFYASGEDYDD